MSTDALRLDNQKSTTVTHSVNLVTDPSSLATQFQSLSYDNRVRRCKACSFICDSLTHVLNLARIFASMPAAAGEVIASLAMPDGEEGGRTMQRPLAHCRVSPF